MKIAKSFLKSNSAAGLRMTTFLFLVCVSSVACKDVESSSVEGILGFGVSTLVDPLTKKSLYPNKDRLLWVQAPKSDKTVYLKSAYWVAYDPRSLMRVFQAQGESELENPETGAPIDIKTIILETNASSLFGLRQLGVKKYSSKFNGQSVNVTLVGDFSKVALSNDDNDNVPGMIDSSGSVIYLGMMAYDTYYGITSQFVTGGVMYKNDPYTYAYGSVQEYLGGSDYAINMAGTRDASTKLMQGTWTGDFANNAATFSLVWKSPPLATQMAAKLSPISIPDWTPNFVQKLAGISQTLDTKQSWFKDASGISYSFMFPTGEVTDSLFTVKSAAGPVYRVNLTTGQLSSPLSGDEIAALQGKAQAVAQTCGRKATHSASRDACSSDDSAASAASSDGSQEAGSGTAADPATSFTAASDGTTQSPVSDSSAGGK